MSGTQKVQTYIILDKHTLSDIGIIHHKLLHISCKHFVINPQEINFAHLSLYNHLSGSGSIRQNIGES